MEDFVDVIALSDLKSKGRFLTQIDKKFLTLFMVNEEILAVDELCPHRAGPLSEGDCEGYSIVCPWHGAKFDLRTGSQESGPSPRGIKTYETRVESGRVFIKRPAA